MKTKMNFLIMAVLLIAVTFAGCHKTPVNPGTAPEVTTDSATNITKISAILNGELINTGGHDITVSGFTTRLKVL